MLTEVGRKFLLPPPDLRSPSSQSPRGSRLEKQKCAAGGDAGSTETRVGKESTLPFPRRPAAAAEIARPCSEHITAPVLSWKEPVTPGPYISVLLIFLF